MAVKFPQVEYTLKIDYNSDSGMHELSVTQGMLSIVLEKANGAQASRVSKINLVVGELSGIAGECVQFYFDLLSKDTMAAEAILSLRQLPTQLRCRNCATVFSPCNGNWACPDCRGQNIEIMSGRELYVESIEVE